LLVFPAACAEPDRPVPDRVVLVTIDTLRADHVGCYGSQHARTPVLDTLAAAGVRFTAAVSPAPLTLPSHASLLTGLDPPGHGVRHNSIHRLADGLPTLAEHAQAAGFASAAFVGSLVLDRRFGLARGFAAYDDRMQGHSSRLAGFAERPADRVVDAALAWLERAPQRFLLWVHFYDPHADHIPPKGFAAAFASHPYDGEIAFADLQLGRLLDGVRARFGGDGLLVAVTSDHGESLGEHGERTHSYTVYDATQRIPLILAGTGIPRGKVVDAPVGLVDVAPTLLAAIRAAPLPDSDGRDLAPLLAGGPAPARTLYVETLATWLDYGWSPLVGLRTDAFKYIRAPRRELYDLRSDPGELHDVAAASPEIVERLDADLERHLERGRRVAETVEVGAEDRARLESLGYVVPAAAAGGARPDRGEGPDPKDEMSLLERVADAQLHGQRGRFREGLDLLRGVENPPTHLSVLRAALAYHAGEYALAASDAARALAAEPRRADAVLVYASALEAQGDMAGARAAYERAVSLMPRSEEGWRGVLRTAEAQGDAPAAQAARRRADGLAQAEPAGAAAPE
jgi:arylsulfatase A-like enzyme